MHVPVHEKVSRVLEKHTGWIIVPAENRYLSDVQWFAHLAKKHFPATSFFRKPEELDFTPEPDLFHDFFGHMPQMMHPRLARLAHRFGQAFKLAKNKDDIARLWWHTFEFGLIKEAGKVKIFGAGLLSSKDELLHCQNPSLWKPFDFEVIKQTPKAVASVHPQFFVLESIEQLEETLDALSKEESK